jgi:hypothetical protein
MRYQAEIMQVIINCEVGEWSHAMILVSKTSASLELHEGNFGKLKL